MTEREALLLLNQIPSCDARKVRLLLDAVGDVRDIVKEEYLTFIAKKTPFGARFAQAVRTSIKKFDVKAELDELHKQSINIISFLDDEYPADLLEIHDPPILLYTKGTITAADSYCVSIVGSRNASFYGQETAERIAFGLASHGITIVSGLALGIDSAAHRGALRAAGRTIAVLGSGIDILYPPENKKLSESIARHGAMVSEFPLHTQPFPYHFPKRNRIISGMSKGTVVVEAAKRSGSLITARLALEEGREVYSVPGQAHSFRSHGTHTLIKEGARLITSADEIIEDLFPHSEDLKALHHKNTATSGNRTDNDHEDSTRKECKIISFLNSQPKHIDEIATYTDISENEIYSLLTHLEIVHKVKKIFGSGYVKS